MKTDAVASLEASSLRRRPATQLTRPSFIRERIELVHSHVALSALGMEAILHARTLGLKAVFTDHSLLGLGGYGEIWGARIMCWPGLR